MPPLKSLTLAKTLDNRHCSFVGTVKNGIPFSATMLTKFGETYDPKEELKDNQHIGQRKLLLSEIQLLNHYYSKNKATHASVYPTIVYVGAAPGIHLLFLKYMFPKVRFILYDGAKFDPRLRNDLSGSFELYNDYFTDETCKTLKKRFNASLKSDLLFISDIRMDQKDKGLFEKQVVIDNALQHGWIKILKPKYSLLKFRLPYNLKHGQSYNYIKGKVMYQMWPPSVSGETRLLVSKSAIGTALVPYDFKVYEEAMFFHNKWARRYCFPLASASDSDLQSIVYSKKNTHCTCYDCMAELYTLQEYTKLDLKPKPKDLKQVLLEINKPMYDLRKSKFGQKVDLTNIDEFVIKAKR